MGWGGWDRDTHLNVTPLSPAGPYSHIHEANASFMSGWFQTSVQMLPLTSGCLGEEVF